MGVSDQTCYDVAEYLLFNKDYFRSMLTAEYLKARKLPSTDAKAFIEERLLYKLAENSKFGIGDIEDAFSDERVRIIIDKYYLKDFGYEH